MQVANEGWATKVFLAQMEFGLVSLKFEFKPDPKLIPLIPSSLLDSLKICVLLTHILCLVSSLKAIIHRLLGCIFRNRIRTTRDLCKTIIR